jgi:hypothetical protein
MLSRPLFRPSRGLPTSKQCKQIRWFAVGLILILIFVIWVYISVFLSESSLTSKIELYNYDLPTLNCPAETLTVAHDIIQKCSTSNMNTTQGGQNFEWHINAGNIITFVWILPLIPASVIFIVGYLCGKTYLKFCFAPSGSFIAAMISMWIILAPVTGIQQPNVKYCFMTRDNIDLWPLVTLQRSCWSSFWMSLQPVQDFQKVLLWVELPAWPEYILITHKNGIAKHVSYLVVVLALLSICVSAFLHCCSPPLDSYSDAVVPSTMPSSYLPLQAVQVPTGQAEEAEEQLRNPQEQEEHVDWDATLSEQETTQ